MALRGCKASNTYREGNAGLSGHPPANLIHDLKMWNRATGRGGVCWVGCGVGGVSRMDYFSSS